MRKLLLLLTLLAFVVAAPMAMAQTKEKPKKEEKKITCCIKGECKEGMTKADCKKEKGKVVKDCSKCKPPKKPEKK